MIIQAKGPVVWSQNSGCRNRRKRQVRAITANAELTRLGSYLYGGVGGREGGEEARWTGQYGWSIHITVWLPSECWYYPEGWCPERREGLETAGVGRVLEVSSQFGLLP